MPGILTFSENSSVSKQLITAGLGLKEATGQPIYTVVIENEVEQLTTTGIDKVFVLSGDSLRPECYVRAIAELAERENISVCLFGGTLRGKDIAGQVAAMIKAGMVSEAQALKCENGSITTTRLVYGGLAVATQTVELPAVVTLPFRNYEEAQAVSDACEVVYIKVKTMDDRVTIQDRISIVREGTDISDAKRIVCVGRGLSGKGDLNLIENLAETVGAEIACSRGIAEDYHWLPVERYIGISGQKVKPELYFGIGISGQVQHVAGMRESKIIVAVDVNEKAPIFQAVDYGIVGDMYEVIPLLTAALKR